jgi:hypothetical protein
MNKDGRITIPKLVLQLLQKKVDGKSIVGHILEVRLEPTEQ